MRTLTQTADLAIDDISATATQDSLAIADAIAGDTRAFGVLVRHHAEAVHATIARVVGDETDAKDITQDAFIRAYRKLATFRGDASFRTWVTGIGVNLARNHHKTQMRQRLIELDFGSEAELTRETQPTDEMGANEREVLLQTALDALPVNLREVLILRLMHGMSYREISKALACPMGTVMSRLSHAKRLITQKLSLLQHKRRGLP